MHPHPWYTPSMDTKPASPAADPLSLLSDTLRSYLDRLAQPYRIIEKIHSMVPHKWRPGIPSFEIRLTLSGGRTEPSIYRGYGDLWFVWSGTRWIKMDGPLTVTLAELVAMWEFGEPKGWA